MLIEGVNITDPSLDYAFLGRSVNGDTSFLTSTGYNFDLSLGELRKGRLYFEVFDAFGANDAEACSGNSAVFGGTSIPNSSLGFGIQPGGIFQFDGVVYYVALDAVATAVRDNFDATRVEPVPPELFGCSSLGFGVNDEFVYPYLPNDPSVTGYSEAGNASQTVTFTRK